MLPVAFNRESGDVLISFSHICYEDGSTYLINYINSPLAKVFRVLRGENKIVFKGSDYTWHSEELSKVGEVFDTNLNKVKDFVGMASTQFNKYMCVEGDLTKYPEGTYMLINIEHLPRRFKKDLHSGKLDINPRSLVDTAPRSLMHLIGSFVTLLIVTSYVILS